MKSAQCILVLSQVMFALAKPLPVIESLDLVLEARDAPAFRIAGGGGNNRNNNNGDNEGAAGENGRENGQAEGGEEAGEGEGAENEVEQAGQFDVPITLPGGNKVDTLYPPGVSSSHPPSWTAVDTMLPEGRRLTEASRSKTASSKSSSRTPTAAP